MARDLKSYYESRYYSDKVGFNKRRLELQRDKFLRELRTVKKLKPDSKSLLDVGYGVGYFLIVARDFGFKRIMGIEASDKMIEIGRRLGFKVHKSFKIWKDSYLKGRKFDVVTMHQVLEHVENSEDYLGGANKLLNKGGVLIISVPNIEGFSAHVFGKKCDHFHKDHINLLTRRELTALLRNSGFRVAKCYTEGIQISNFKRTGRNKRGHCEENFQLSDRPRKGFDSFLLLGRNLTSWFLALFGKN